MFSGFGGYHLLILLLYVVGLAVAAAAIFGIAYFAARLAVTHVLRRHGLIPPASPAPTMRNTPPSD